MKVLELLAKHKALEELSRPGRIGVGNRKTMFWIGIFCRYAPSEDKGLETASLKKWDLVSCQSDAQFDFKVNIYLGIGNISMTSIF